MFSSVDEERREASGTCSDDLISGGDSSMTEDQEEKKKLQKNRGTARRNRKRRWKQIRRHEGYGKRSFVQAIHSRTGSAAESKTGTITHAKENKEKMSSSLSGCFLVGKWSTLATQLTVRAIGPLLASCAAKRLLGFEATNPGFRWI